ncbi:T9SS type A sorting domain-containing protein [uncultured Algibacter sp.]|uniref:T9SS type A sorting domain-containing protein n=1 Tax=uncultured Algibacter sp. TaxID=298659 RepID=UPI002616BAD0|nr:T9SS type A sorting domain-containing protein [uncultured Algibacter sp.]
MKKNYTFLLLIMSVVGFTAFGQATRTWDGGGANNNWSTAANWSDDTVPVAGDTAVLNADVTMDVDATVELLSVTANTTLSGSGTLTIDTTGNATNHASGILVTGADLVISAPLVIVNTDGQRVKVEIASGAAGTISFSGAVTHSNDVDHGSGDDASSKISYSGSLTTANNFRIGGNVELATGFDGSAATDDVQLFSGKLDIAGTDIVLADLGFSEYEGRANSSAVLEFNVANTLDTPIRVFAGKNLTLNVNTNQTANTNTLDVQGNLVIAITNGSDLSFSNSSGKDWTGGTVTITGATYDGSKVSNVKFGSNDTDLTVDQLALISMDGYTGTTINASGFLVQGNTLSVDKFVNESAKRISYPSFVDANITFSKTIQTVKLVNISGQLIREKNNASSLDVSSLKSGLYFLVLDNAKVEKFVKK